MNILRLKEYAFTHGSTLIVILAKSELKAWAKLHQIMIEGNPAEWKILKGKKGSL
tara:strand:- start:1677 stop:1841 length:165 start_codon:yes stop_codon:yes gene_type:complete